MEQLLDPINTFAQSGSHRRAILENLNYLKNVLHGDPYFDRLLTSADRFLDEVREPSYLKTDPCFKELLSRELATFGRVSHEAANAIRRNEVKIRKALSSVASLPAVAQS